MNINSLPALPSSQISRNHTDATEKDANFLSLRLLNKRIRIRLSLEPLNLDVLNGKCNFIAVANSLGWFAAVTRRDTSENQIILSPLADLRASLLSSTAEEGEILFEPRRALSLKPATPTHITFAFNDGRLVVGFAEGPILVYDTAKLFSNGSEHIEPLHSFPPTSAGPLRQLLSNPGDLPELVAVRRDADGNPNAQPVELLDVNQLQSVGGWRNGTSPETTPTTVSWSPKGKQLAVGVQSGDVLTFSPSATFESKFHVPKPPQVQNYSIITSMWLANPTFYAIYAPPGPLQPDADQKHYLITQDFKANAAADVQLTPPYFPSPALRPPGSFSVVLRNWNPARFLIFIGDGPSGDIGLVGCISNASTGEEVWCNLGLEETSTPSLPLDKDSNDTVILGLELDLTNTQSLKSGDERPDHPAPPIMYAYASDGTLQAWYIINSEGGLYPGMIGTSANAALPTTPKPSFATINFQSPDRQVTSPSKSVFGQSPTSVFGSSGFGQQSTVSPFAQPSTQLNLNTMGQQITSGFGQPSAFGQSGTSTFGQSSSSAFNTTGTSAFSQRPAGSTGGFGSFASQGPAKFGSSGFGFGASGLPSASAPTEAPAISIAPSAEMTDTDSGFDGLTLGVSSESQPNMESKPSIFGSFGQSTTSSATPQPTSAFGSTGLGGSGGSSVLKPAAGFGAFAKYSQKETSTSPPSNPEPIKASPAFGASAFTTPPQAGFGQPSFGQSSFGTSSFGKLSFGVTSSLPTPSTFGSSKGFSAFAQSGPSGFTAASQSSPPQRPAFVSSGDSRSVFDTSKPAPASASESEQSVFGKSSSPTPGPGQSPSVPVRPATPNSSPDGSPRLVMSGKGRPLTPESPAEGSKPLPGFEKPSAFGPLNSTSSSPSPSTIKSATPSSGFGAFGNLKSTPSAFKPAEGFGAFGSQSAPGLTTSPFGKFGSPKLESSTQETKGVSAFGTASSASTFGPTSGSSTAVSSSPFQANSNSSGLGAFGGLTSTPSAFKPAAGFGAFGNKTASASPFINPKPTEGTSVFGQSISAFGPGGSGNATSPSKSATSTPTFGTPSALGAVSNKHVFGKPALSSSSVFGSPSTTKTTPANASGAFSAFSGGSNSLSSLSGSAKGSSFSEMLRTQKDSDESKPSSPASTLTKALAQQKALTDELKAEAGQEDDAELQALIASSLADISVKSSLGSFSEDSSFVKIPSKSADNEDHDNGGQTPDGSEDDEDDLENADEYDEDASSFISASLSSGSDSAGGEDENETLPLSPLPEESWDTLEAANVPLPATPQPEEASPESTPRSFLTPRQEPVQIDEGSSKDATVTEPKPSPVLSPSTPVPNKTPPEIQHKSTTPSGSPEKQEESVAAPKPVLPSSSSSGLGLGRPTTRPSRSSPLASTPLSSDEKEEKAPPITSSQSAPALSKPRPASPRKPFGQIPAAPKVESAQKPTPSVALPTTSHPKTPSPLSGSGITSAKPPTLGSPSLTPTSTPPPFPPVLSRSAAPSPTPSPAPTFFGQKSGSLPALDLFRSTMPETPVPKTIQRPSFELGRQPSLPPSNLFGSTTPQAPAPAPPSVPKPAPPPSFESGMQEEFQVLYVTLNKELETLQKLAQEATVLRTRLAKPSGKSHSKADLGDASKWSFSDLDLFGKTLMTLEADILEINRHHGTLLQPMRELGSDMLKAETRKEEIERFSRAKADPEFAKMLKARTLGPEHVETQVQLRKRIRTINGRMEQLEGHLRACKKKLAEYRTGKPSFKPPSLDTINRTYRNIDIAIEQQANQIADLTARVAKLDPESALSTPSRRDKRLPDDAVTRPFNVTPSVAASTAAALNAERSAQRLKTVLAKLDRRPPLNTQAAQAAAAPQALESPAKPLPSTPLRLLGTGQGSLFGAGTLLPGWSSPETPGQDSRRHDRQFRQSAHAKPVPLKKSPTSVPSTITAFDWGPLPGVPPATSLSPDMRPASGRKPKA